MARPKRSRVIETSAQSSESARRVPTFARRSFVILCLIYLSMWELSKKVWFLLVYDIMSILLCITNCAPELLPVYIVVKDGWKLYLREFLLIIK